MIGREPFFWIVAFYDPDPRRHWWDLFTRPGFRHVTAFGWITGTETWLMLDWSRAGLAVLALTPAEVDRFVAMASVNRGRFLKVRPGDRRIGRRRAVALSYCVPVVKHLLGLRFFALTPWQLFCALRRRGCPEIFLSVKEAMQP